MTIKLLFTSILTLTMLTPALAQIVPNNRLVSKQVTAVGECNRVGKTSQYKLNIEYTITNVKNEASDEFSLEDNCETVSIRFIKRRGNLLGGYSNPKRSCEDFRVDMLGLM